MIPLGAIVLGGLLAYANAFHGEFQFDDDPEIVTQRLIRDTDNFLRSWEAYRAYPNRVLVYFTFALNYAIGGLDTTGYHVVNIVVHLGTALLVYALALLSFRTPYLRRSALTPWGSSVALVAGLLFVTHPIQTQAVTYVVQRLTSLATFFYVLAVVLYARWRLAREAGKGRGLTGVLAYTAIVGSALAAMKSKEFALTLPVMIAVYEFAFFDGPWRRRLRWLAPLLATTAVIPISTFGVHNSFAGLLADVAKVKIQTELSRLDYLRTEFTVIARYLRLLILPVGQNLDYDYPVYRSFLEPEVVLSALLLLAVIAVAVWTWGGRLGQWTRLSFDPASRLVAFGIVWFFTALSVESSVIPIADVIVEHRVYLPSVGFVVAVAVLGLLGARRVAPARAATATVVGGALIAVVLGALTIARNQVWSTELALWSDVVAKSPRKSRARDNLGLALAHSGREAEAVVQFREAVRFDPRNVAAWNNLGVALGKIGRAGESAQAYLNALHVDPGHPEALHGLGRIYLNLGQYDDAATLFQRAIHRRRDYAEAYANLAVAWNQVGRYSETVRLLEGAGDVVRTLPEAHFNLGVAYVLGGDRGAAEREVRLLAAIAPQLAARLADFVARQQPAGMAGSR
jgi:Flp pilus assembly protein TadD